MYEWRVIQQEEDYPFAFLSDDGRGVSIYLNVAHDSDPFCIVGTMSFPGIKAYLQGDVYVREDGGLQVSDTKVAMADGAEEGESSVEDVKKASEFIPEFVREIKRGFISLAPALRDAIASDSTFGHQYSGIPNYREEFLNRLSAFISSPVFNGSAQNEYRELSGWRVYWKAGGPNTEDNPYGLLKDIEGRTVSDVSIDRSTGKFALRVNYYPDGDNLKMSAMIFPNDTGDVKIDELYLDVKVPGHYNTRFKEFVSQLKSGIRAYAGTVYRTLAKDPQSILGASDSSDDYNIIAKWLRRNACMDTAKDSIILDCMQAVKRSKENEDLEDLLDKIENAIKVFCWSITKARLRLSESSEKQLVFDVDIDHEDWDGNVMHESLVVTAKPKFDGVDVDVKGTRDEVLKGDVKTMFFYALLY